MSAGILTRDEWLWMPHPAHYCGASQCRFHLATYVGGYIVSTVGERVPRESIMRAKAKGALSPGDAGEDEYLAMFGYDEIATGKTYETMVFRAMPQTHPEGSCCPWEADVMAGEKDCWRGNSPVEAVAAHMRLCEKWAEAGAA